MVHFLVILKWKTDENYSLATRIKKILCKLHNMIPDPVRGKKHLPELPTKTLFAY